MKQKMSPFLLICQFLQHYCLSTLKLNKLLKITFSLSFNSLLLLKPCQRFYKKNVVKKDSISEKKSKETQM